MILETYLKENNISYREFAKSVGISPQYLCDLIRGRNLYISEDLALKIKLHYPKIDIFKKVIIKYKIKEEK